MELGCLLSAFLDTPRSLWGQKAAATALVLCLIPVSKEILGENWKHLLNRTYVASHTCAMCFHTKHLKKILTSWVYLWSPQSLSLLILFSAGLIRDLMGAVLQWHGGGPLNSALLCHFVTPPADYCIDSRLQYRDQHNASVSVQGHPIKYSCSKGAYGLSSKLIVPPGESLHWDVCPWVLRRCLRVRVLVTVIIYYCLVSEADKQWR